MVGLLPLPHPIVLRSFMNNVTQLSQLAANLSHAIFAVNQLIMNIHVRHRHVILGSVVETSENTTA